MANVAVVCVWALVLLLGIQLGAGIFETRVLMPLWAAHPPQSIGSFFSQQNRPDSGKRLWIYLSPITTLVSLLNLVVAFMSDKPWRAWWLIAAGCSLGVMIATFAYFVPVLLYFEKVAHAPPADTVAKVRTWVALNYLRAGLLAVAWIAALKVFAYVA